MIGEQFDDSEEICGVVVSPRKAGQNKLALWTRTAKDREKQKRIGMYFKTSLQQPKDLLISYQVCHQHAHCYCMCYASDAMMDDDNNALLCCYRYMLIV